TPLSAIWSVGNNPLESVVNANVQPSSVPLSSYASSSIGAGGTGVPSGSLRLSGLIGAEGAGPAPSSMTGTVILSSAYPPTDWGRGGAGLAGHNATRATGVAGAVGVVVETITAVAAALVL